VKVIILEIEGRSFGFTEDRAERLHLALGDILLTALQSRPGERCEITLDHGDKVTLMHSEDAARETLGGEKGE
jgi:hypothetical protein